MKVEKIESKVGYGPKWTVTVELTECNAVEVAEFVTLLAGTMDN